MDGEYSQKNRSHTPSIGDNPIVRKLTQRAHTTLCLGSSVVLVPLVTASKKPGVMGIVYGKWLSAEQCHIKFCQI